MKINVNLEHLLTHDEVISLIPKTKSTDHKGTNGKICILAGSEQYPGASVLCASASLRTGAGIIYAMIPGKISSRFSVVPQIIPVSIGNDEKKSWDMEACEIAVSKLINLNPNAVCVGPGMGDVEISGILNYLVASKIKSVYDADCLNYISKNRQYLKKLTNSIILTPHPGEMSRLSGVSVKEIAENPKDFCIKYARLWNCVVLLKGSTSYISDGRKVYINTNGNEGLAKGGSGDILSGIIVSLLGIGMNTLEAAACGSYLLGLSSEKAYEILGKRMLIGSDIISVIKSTAENYSI